MYIFIYFWVLYLSFFIGRTFEIHLFLSPVFECSLFPCAFQNFIYLVKLRSELIYLHERKKLKNIHIV